MAWIPGITSLSIGDIWRSPSDIGAVPEIRKNLQDRTKYQMMNYYNADVVTKQTIALASVKQPNTISKLGDVSNQSRVQLGDLIAARKGNQNG